MEWIILFLLLFLLLLFLTAPRFSKRKQWKAFRNDLYAHRGYHDDIFCENSYGAFENAKNHGYGIELDVQITKDQVPIILHDDSLLRACGVDKQVDECLYDEIKDLKLFDTPAHLPTLENVLQLIDGKVPLIIEIKQKKMNYAVCIQAWKYLKHYQGPYVVESFNPLAMNWFKVHHPEVIRGQLSCSYQENPAMNSFLRFVLKNLLANCLSRPDFIAYRVTERKQWMNQLHRILLHTPQVYWTVQEALTYDQVKKQGVVIFEHFQPQKEQSSL